MELRHDLVPLLVLNYFVVLCGLAGSENLYELAQPRMGWSELGLGLVLEG